MPVITVAIHPIDREQKTRLVREMTKTAADITNVPVDKFVVFIDEHANDSIGLGGRTRGEILEEAPS